MDPQQQQQFKRILDIFLRRKKLITTFFLTAVIVGLVLYIQTPKLYRSEALIVYLPQKIKTGRSTQDEKIRFLDMVNTMTQQVTSRTNLEELITQFDLYPDLREKLPLEDVVVKMRESHISVDAEDRGDSFTVSYQGRTPKQVTLVTNALAAKFIEVNLRLREEQVVETSAYINDEVQQAKEALDRMEQRMQDYKLQHFNEMPHQLQNNLERISSLQSQYQNYQNRLQEMERTKVLVQEQLALHREKLKHLRAKADKEIEALQENEQNLHEADRQKLDRMRIELESLRAKYTDQHPDVKRLKVLIANLEDKLASMQNPLAERPETPAETDARLQESQVEQLERQLDDLEYNMARISTEIEENRQQLKRYKKWVEATPIREAEWTSLSRDYEQLQKHYEQLVSMNLQAKSAESLEKRQKGSQFKIIDSANTPEKPFKPNFLAIMLKAILAGLGIGAGLAFAIELFDTSFKDASDLEKYLDMPVICSIPLVLTAPEKKKERVLFHVWTALLVVSVLALSGSIAYLIIKEVIII